ncbi:MAG: hypothetical protein ACYS7M_10540 [Planctomycetota bacterium]|jgi:hypothetical protein
MPDEETVAPQSPKSKKLVGILIVAAIMLLEGAGIYAAMKLLGSGPDDVIASDQGQGAGDSADQGQRVEQSEVLIAETDASNNMSGRLLVYHIEVSALVTAAGQDRLVRLIEERQATMYEDYPPPDSVRVEQNLRGRLPNTGTAHPQADAVSGAPLIGGGLGEGPIMSPTEWI